MREEETKGALPTAAARSIQASRTAGAANARCPIHSHPLINVHKVREGERLVIGQTCPEPYCQHSLMVARPSTAGLEPARHAS